MFLAIILGMVIIFLMIFLVAVISVGGAGVIIVFGDVIVCIAIISGIIYLICRKKKE